MTLRGASFGLAAVFAIVFVLLVVWAFAAQPKELRGNVICASDVASARLVGGGIGQGSIPTTPEQAAP